MHPDLGVDAGELPVERLGLKLELGIAAVGPGGQPVMAALLDLDHRTPGGGQFAQFGIHNAAEIEHHRSVVGVMLVPQHSRRPPVRRGSAPALSTNSPLAFPPFDPVRDASGTDRRPRPLSYHTDEILANFGYDRSEIAPL